MRITRGERLILLNQVAIMRCLLSKGSSAMLDNLKYTEELLKGAHTDGQSDEILRNLENCHYG
jgi:hypothetical protein